MKISKKVLQILTCVCVLVSLILSQMPITTFASQSRTELLKPETKNIQIKKINSNSLIVKTSTSEEIITVNETSKAKTITISNSKTGEKNYILYDKNANTVYSSMTGKTINLDKHQDLSPNAPTISPRSISNYETKYISYAQIQSMIGGTASTAAVIGAVLYFIPGAQGIGAAMSSISTIVSTLNNTGSASNSHGIKLTIKVTKYYRRKHVFRITRSITSCGFY